MKIQRRNKEVLSLESVALSDIIMNLFIFFFISFSLLYTFNPQQESKIKVNLPQGMTDVRVQGESPLIVAINAKNEIFIGSAVVPLPLLVKRIGELSPEAKKQGMIVKADREASVNYFVKVLDAAKQAGIEKLGVAIEVDKNKQP